MVALIRKRRILKIICLCYLLLISVLYIIISYKTGINFKIHYVFTRMIQNNDKDSVMKTDSKLPSRIQYYASNPGMFQNMTHLHSALLAETPSSPTKPTDTTLSSLTSFITSTIQYLKSLFTNYTLDYFHIPSKTLSSDLKLRIKSLTAFDVQITLEELDVMRDLLQMFDSVMKKKNLPYMLYGGTLLGSYRHHDIIPWDDDLDVWVNLTERPKMKDIFQSLEPKYIFVTAGLHDKIYRHDAQNNSAYSWGWPYIDVSYYMENETHIWNIAKAYGLSALMPKSVVFPLHNRPLYNLSLPAPFDSFAALRWTYPKLSSVCYMFGYSHIIEKDKIKGLCGKKNCSDLADRYAFVHRYPHPNGVREVLQFKGINLTEFVTSEPTYAITKTFELALKPGFSPPPDVSLPNQYK